MRHGPALRYRGWSSLEERVSRENPPHALYYQIFDIKPGRGEERKLKIIEAFIDCVASRGLDHTSFDTIGKMVRMNRTHVAYYFANRDELVRTAVRYAVAAGQHITIAHVEKANGWRNKLRAVIEGPFEWLDRYPKHAAVMALFYYICTYDASYRDLQNNIRTMGEQRILSCFNFLPAVPDAQARELSRTIQSLMAGTLHNRFASDYPVSLDRLKAITVRTVMELVKVYGFID